MDATTPEAVSAAVPRPRGDLRALSAGLPMPVLLPGDAGYDDARRVFNATVEHRPVAVLQPRNAAEVAAVLRLARDRGLDVSVKGGGHGIVGHAIAGELVLDLSRMRDVRVDPRARTARVGGGAVWGDVDVATSAHGLAVPGGRITSTGVAGLTLGGGQGWLSCKHGLTIDNLLAVDLVTAEGRQVTASADEQPELFWALRGGGGNFGVATAFTFGLHSVGRMVVAGMLFHPAERTAELIRFYDEFLAEAPEDFGGCLAVMCAPSEPFVPPHLVGRPVAVVIVTWFGDLDEGERVLRPLRAFGPPMVDVVQPMPYPQLQRLLDEANPFGLRNYWSAAYLSEIMDGFLAATVDSALDAPSPLSTVLLAPMGEPVARVPQEATAFGHREGRWLFHPFAMWEQAADDAVNIAWARRLVAAATPHAGEGTYLNADTEQTRADRVRFAFGDAAYRRLVEVKRAWDPDNLFRHNANIDPRGT